MIFFYLTSIMLAVILLGFVTWYALLEWRLQPFSTAQRRARKLNIGNYATLSAGDIYYRWDGTADGNIIVMIHGFSTPHFIFEQNVEALVNAGFRVLRFDHFGRGWSARPRLRYDADFYDSTLLELLDALKVNKPVGLVGLSMGGAIASQFAGRHSERVSKVFLFVSAGLDVSMSGGATMHLLRLPLIGTFLWRWRGSETLLADPQYNETKLAPINKLRGDIREQMAYRGFLDALLSTLQNAPMARRNDVFKQLHKTGIPLMAVFGDADPTIPISSAARLATLVPTARIHIVKDGTHGLNYQNHTEINPLLIEWFSN